jgi:hypothetical protein
MKLIKERDLYKGGKAEKREYGGGKVDRRAWSLDDRNEKPDTGCD